MENLKIGNRTFAALPACSFGDYGGDSSVGLANIRYLREQFADRMVVDSFNNWHNDGAPKSVYIDRTWVDRPESDFDGVSLIVLKGSYSSESAYLDVDCEEYREIAAALDQYPALNDEAVSEVELEWENDAIVKCCRDIGLELSDDYLTSDDNDFATLQDVWHKLDAEKQAEIVRQGMRDGNVYASVEYSSSYISADELAPYVRAILQKDASLVRAYKLADGTLIEVDAIESENQPDPYPAIPECSDSTEYVRKFCELNHLRG